MGIKYLLKPFYFPKTNTSIQKTILAKFFSSKFQTNIFSCIPMCKQHTFTFNELDENTPTIEAYIIREKPNTRAIIIMFAYTRHRLKLIHYRLKLISTLFFRLKPTFAPRFSVKQQYFRNWDLPVKINKPSVSLARPEKKH